MASAAAGLLGLILAVGLLQLGLFIAVKRLVRARRTSPGVTAVGDDAVALTPARIPEASVAAFQAGPTRATRTSDRWTVGPITPRPCPAVGHTRQSSRFGG